DIDQLERLAEGVNAGDRLERVEGGHHLGAELDEADPFDVRRMGEDVGDEVAVRVDDPEATAGGEVVEGPARERLALADAGGADDVEVSGTLLVGEVEAGRLVRVVEGPA